MRVLCSTLTFAVVNFYLVFIPPFYIMYVFMMYITFINSHIFYVTNYVFIATLICHTFNMSCYFLKVALQFWQWTLGNYSLVLEINFIHASYAKSVLWKRMIVSYDNGIFWICLGLMMASASLLTLGRKDEGNEKKIVSIWLKYWYDKIRFNCQYRNVSRYVPTFYVHTPSIIQ